MPNYRRNVYDFVVDASYNPFQSMTEMLVPFQMYKQEYDKAESDYLDLNTKADAFETLAGKLPEGSKAQKMYQTYADELKSQADDLARYGLTMNNRRALTGLKRRYEGEVGKLINLATLRKAKIEEQRKLAQQDPTRLFSRDMATTTLDDFLGNSDLGYESYSGALLAKQVGDAASALSKALGDVRNGKAIDPYTKTWLEERGFTPAQIQEAINNPNSPGVLNTIVNNVVNSSGISRWADPATLRQAYGIASQGLWNAVGQSQVHSYTDKANEAALQHMYKELEADNEATRKAALVQQQAQEAKKLAINPTNIYNPKGRGSVAETAARLENFAKYFTTDSKGRPVMTKEGLDEYNRKVSNATTSPTGMGYMTPSTDSPFKKFIDELGGKDMASKRQMGNLGNLWKSYYDKNKNGVYDPTRSTEFVFTPDEADLKTWKSAIQRAAQGTGLEEVTFDPETNKFKPTGEVLDMSDLNDDKIIINSTAFSPYGSTVTVKDKDGELHRYRLPKGINPTNEQNRDNNMRNAEIMQQKFLEFKKNGYIMEDGKKWVPSQEELMLMDAKYKEYLQKAYQYHSQLGVTNKVKPQEFNPYGY